MKLRVVDGAPGTGKTRRIVQVAQDEGWGSEQAAVITYTNDAAAVIESRAPGLASGTIYSLSWPQVKPFSTGGGGTHFTGSKGRGYGSRKIKHSDDPALSQYEADAPSRKAQTRQDDLAKQLHAWKEGEPPPFDLAREAPVGQLKFVLPVARWLEAGAPIPEDEKLDLVAIDEAQDMSSVELRAALALVRAGGEATIYGDPGQSIFGRAKGLKGSALPPAWELEGAEYSVIDKGWRVGDPAASVAAKVLNPYYRRSASKFRADHRTEILLWEDVGIRPGGGMVLGYSRRAVAKTFREWGLRKTGVVPNAGDPDDPLILSTGHAAKGAEADSVYLLPWGRKALSRLDMKEPETLRLLYVMLTRARKRLFVPRTLRARLPL